MRLRYCCKGSYCSHKLQGATRHYTTAQHGKREDGVEGTPREEVIRVPQELVRVLMKYAVQMALEVRWKAHDKYAKATKRKRNE